MSFQSLKTLATLTNIACWLVRAEIACPLFLGVIYVLGMVDVLFADVAQPDQARIFALNAHHFLKNGGHFVISIKVRDALESSYFPRFSLCR